MRSWLLCLQFISVAPATLIAQEPFWVGRWVNVDRTDLELLVFVIEPDGTAHSLIPAPQFEATYQFEQGQLTLIATDEPPLSDFVLEGDTLRHEGWPVLVQVSDGDEEPGVQGTWRRRTAADGDSWFMTFRSDGQVVLEVGFTGRVVQPSADTTRIDFVDGPGPSISFQLWTVGDTLFAQNSDLRRFVRRSWGCFGDSVFDGPSSECR